MTALDLYVSPLGRVEGDLDVRVTIDNGVVTSAWTEAAMFRGFEIILRGKDPQAGLVVCPRICGICGGSHLYKSAYALDTAWKTHMPENATLIRNIAQACETLQSIPRYFYALFAIDLTNKNYAKSKMYDEAVRRFAPYVGHQLPDGRGALQQAGRGLRDLRRAVAALELHGARRRDVRADAVRRHPLDRDPRALEGQLARGSVAGLQRRPLAGEQDLGRRAGLGGRERVALQQRLRLLHPLLPRHRPGQVRPGRGQLHRHGHLLRPGAVLEPDHRGPQRRADRSRWHLRPGSVVRVRPGQRPRGHQPLLLPGQQAAASVRGGDHPDRSGAGQEAGQVQLGEVAALRRWRPRHHSVGGRSAGPPDGRRRTRTPHRTRTTTRCSSTS